MLCGKGITAMKIYKKNAVLLALCMSGLMLTACGSKNNGQDTDTGTATTPSAANTSAAADDGADSSRSSDEAASDGSDTVTGDIDGDGFIEDAVHDAEDIVDDAVNGAEDILDDITPGEHDDDTMTTTDSNG